MSAPETEEATPGERPSPRREPEPAQAGAASERNVLVTGFEKVVQLFAPVVPELREDPVPPAGALRAGYDYNWELESLACSTRPFGQDKP